jgi:hypothetical protein
MEDATLILIITIGSTFAGLVLRYAFKSKCDTVKVCWGCMNIHRDIVREGPDDSPKEELNTQSKV